MPNFPDITSLTTGNTFGAWYNKTNEMITRLNQLDVASVTGGDGIDVKQHTAVGTTGGFTVEFSGNVTKNTTFSGNVAISGTLTYGALNADITGTQITVPYATGVTVGNAVYITDAGLAQKAQANDECTSEVVGIVTSVTAGNAVIATTGKVSGASLAQLFTGVTGATFIKGAVYFLSAGVSGYGVTAEPDVVSYISKPVLIGITTDTGLILPYRGFIANSGISGTNISGITGAVLSANGTTAAINSIIVDPSTGSVSIVPRTTGHIHTVNQISGCVGTVTHSLTDSGSGINYKQIVDTLADTPSTFTAVVVGSTRTVSSKMTVGNSIFNLFGTFGGHTNLDDVYKLHRIRIIPINIPNHVEAIPFVLYRQINRNGATNFINLGGYNDGAKNAAGQQHIELTMNDFTVVFNVGKTLISGTQKQPILLPIYTKPYSYGSGATGDGITAGTSNGVLDNSAVYPVIYGPTAWVSSSEPLYEGSKCSHNRVYGWSFNSLTLDNAYIGEYLESSIEGTQPNIASPSGYTMDSSILGWNVKYGAVPETIAIGFPSLPTVKQNETTPSRIDLQVILEVYKYNPTTGVTGNIMMLPVQCSTENIYYEMSGKNRTLNAYP